MSTPHYFSLPLILSVTHVYIYMLINMSLIYVNIHYINMKSLKLKTWIEIGEWYGLIFPFQSVGMAESSQKKRDLEMWKTGAKWLSGGMGWFFIVMNIIYGWIGWLSIVILYSYHGSFLHIPTRWGIQDGACWTFVSLACEQQASPWGYGDSHRPHRTGGTAVRSMLQDEKYAVCPTKLIVWAVWGTGEVGHFCCPIAILVSHSDWRTGHPFEVQYKVKFLAPDVK